MLKRVFEGRTNDSIDEDSASLLEFQNWRTRSMEQDGWRKDILRAKVQNSL